MLISSIKIQKTTGKPQSSRVYISPKGESILQHLENCRQRPYTVYKKEVMPAILAQLGLPADTKVRWSQFAGCKCPCSPGFIIENSFNKDIFVSVDMAEESQENVTA